MTQFLASPLGKWIGILSAVLAGTLAQTLMKLGTRQAGVFGSAPLFSYVFKLFTSPLVLLAIVVYGLGVTLYMFMLSRLDLGFLYAVMTALGLVLATLVSALLLREQVSLLRLSGIVMIIVAVFIIARS